MEEDKMMTSGDVVVLQSRSASEAREGEKMGENLRVSGFNKCLVIDLSTPANSSEASQPLNSISAEVLVMSSTSDYETVYHARFSSHDMSNKHTDSITEAHANVHAHLAQPSS